LDARVAVERLLDRWDDDEAAALFAMNVELDEPLALRRADFERVHDVLGALHRDESMPVVSYSPAHLRWWMAGARGRVKVEIILNPERPPKVQGLRLTSVPDPSERLAGIADRLAGLIGELAPGWPPDLELVSDADAAAIDRSLRAAAALFGSVVLGRPIAGDGETTATWPLEGDRGPLDLMIRLDAPDGPIAEVVLVPRPLEPPHE